MVHIDRASWWIRRISNFLSWIPPPVIGSNFKPKDKHLKMIWYPSNNFQIFKTPIPVLITISAELNAFDLRWHIKSYHLS